MLLRRPTRRVRNWVSDSERWAGYRPRPGDIILSTAPKCGTTWMQRILSLLVFQSADVRPLGEVSGWPDFRFRGPVEDTFAAMEAQTHRRFLKAHLPLDALPLYDEVRYIHVARDPRDAALSYHNHQRSFSAGALARFDTIGQEDETLRRPLPRPAEDPCEFFRAWLRPEDGDGFDAPMFFDIERSFWRERRRSNLLLVHYADLKADLDGEMRRIAAFLGQPVDERTWKGLVAAASFAEMKRVAAALIPHTAFVFDGGPDRFLHRGENERWRGVLGDAELAQYQAAIEDDLPAGLIRWLEGGRAAQDPG